jgi:sRNA-binding carbon storage regulator CsrA
MLILRRRVDQEVEVTTRTGELLRIKVTSLTHGQVELGFYDPEHNFAIERPDRAEKAVALRGNATAALAMKGRG